MCATIWLDSLCEVHELRQRLSNAEAGVVHANCESTQPDSDTLNPSGRVRSSYWDPNLPYRWVLGALGPLEQYKGPTERWSSTYKAPTQTPCKAFMKKHKHTATMDLCVTQALGHAQVQCSMPTMKLHEDSRHLCEFYPQA